MDFINKVLSKAKEEGKLSPDLLPWEMPIPVAESTPGTVRARVQDRTSTLPKQLSKFPREMFLDTQRIVENIRVEVKNNTPYTVGVASSHPGEGTSTLTAMIAYIASQKTRQPEIAAEAHFSGEEKHPDTDNRVLLVDSQFVNPSIHKIFGVSLDPGLNELISENVSFDSVVKNIPASRLQVITNGRQRGDILDQVISDRFLAHLNQVKKNYELVFLDIPPLLSSDEAAHLCRFCDGMVLVLSAGQTLWKDLEKVKSLLIHTNVNLLGAVLNNEKSLIPKFFSRWL